MGTGPKREAEETEPRREGEKPGPKYLRILESLRQGIANGQYAPGARLPSEAELVRRLKVSRMTVAKAIHQLQREHLVVRRVGSGTYVAQAVADASQTFGLLIPDLGETEIFEPICRGMVRSPQARGVSLLWGHSFAGVEAKGQQAMELCTHYLEQGVTGVFFAPLEFSADRESTNRAILDRLDEANIPVVLLDRCGLPFPQVSRYDLVGLDNRRAGYVLAKHLIETGARRFCFLTRQGSVETVQARIAGCREALIDAGEGPLSILQNADDRTPPSVIEDLIACRADAVLCANDHLAANLMQLLLGRGIRVPQDLRICGFDDVRYAGLLPVPLTTIHQPCSEIGATAMASMLDRLQNPSLPARNIQVEGSLIVRKSCGYNGYY